jgi:Fe2+ transport system protein FeoA
LRHKTNATAGRKTAATKLNQAAHHQWLEVVEVPQERGASRSLAHLGIRVNEKLCVERAAPWGGPILVKAGATTVAISRTLASRIKVRLLKRDVEEEPCPS